jgi:hypothetical protein
VPSVVLVTAAFEAGARATARARGLPELPIVVLPADLEERDDDAVDAELRRRLPDLLRELVDG